jgi:ABC-2 type transport system permease protein
MSLVMTHTRFQFLETIRVPIAVIGTMMFPALALLFFVVPQEAVAGDPVAATAAAGQLSLFSVVSVCLFQFGAGVAEDRSSAWDPYVRTLPAGVTPRMAGRVLNGVLFALLGMLPVLLVAALLTAASVTPGQLVLGSLALVVAALPFLGMGLAIGYSLTVKGRGAGRPGRAVPDGLRRRTVPAARQLPQLARRDLAATADPGRSRSRRPTAGR